VLLFREGLLFKAHRLVYHSNLGWRLLKKKKHREVGHRHLRERARGRERERGRERGRERDKERERERDRER